MYVSKETQTRTAFYPFTLDIPWTIKRNIIVPKISQELWDKLISKRDINVICPGYFLEALVVSLSAYIFNINNIKVSNWIIPKYYTEMYNFMGINNISPIEGNIFAAYDELIQLMYDYPTPLFFDGGNNVYFNMLFSYGTYSCTEYKNYIKGRNENPFYKQILSNLCFDSSISFNKFDKNQVLKDVKSYLNQYSMRLNKKIFLIDTSKYSFAFFY
jgi:hypothetical protein